MKNGEMIEQTEVACAICHTHTAEVLSHRNRDGGELQTVICPTCGLVWTDPRPAEIKKYYEENYRVEYKGTYEPKLKHVYRAGKVALDRYHKIQNYLKGKKSLFDIGTGGGEFLYLMKSQGLDAQGIEPNRGYGEYSQRTYGINTQIGFFQDVTIDQKFDVVTIWHVLEHTEVPAVILAKMRDMLYEDGLLVVEVPNVVALSQSPNSTFHTAHIYNFNNITLEQLASQVGLVLIDSITSEDGGNITHIYQKAKIAQVPYSSEALVQNYHNVKLVVSSHTDASHLFSKYPYIRPLKKLIRAVDEKLYIKKFSEAKPLLDTLYASIL
jgi:2-polyprenyl-3-methyl-5-hydroxy-6-metoxy-1,4-benzoquinol methylase